MTDAATTPSASGPGMAGAAPYGTRPIRIRRTREELDDLDRAIIAALDVDHPATVRGVFYKVMSAGAVPKTEQAYRVVQRRVLALRRAGAVPYSYITDGTRLRLKPTTWTDLDEWHEDAVASYRRALWHRQPEYVEVWSEKDAISGVISPVTAEWDVPLMIARGFSSETFLWSSAEEINRIGKPTVIYQLGDHDPSGLAAWDQVQDRLRAMVAPAIGLTFERLAVTPEQIVEMDLQTRPTKSSDSRSRGFVGESVEVDAIPSSVLRQIVRRSIIRHIDEEELRLNDAVEAAERFTLSMLMGRS